jgi:hypothetical protein
MSLEQFSAQLFMRLAEFVVWAEQHGEIAAGDPEFARLRKLSEAALASGRLPAGDKSAV